MKNEQQKNINPFPNDDPLDPKSNQIKSNHHVKCTASMHHEPKSKPSQERRGTARQQNVIRLDPGENSEKETSSSRQGPSKIIQVVLYKKKKNKEDSSKEAQNNGYYSMSTSGFVAGGATPSSIHLRKVLFCSSSCSGVSSLAQAGWSTNFSLNLFSRNVV